MADSTTDDNRVSVSTTSTTTHYEKYASVSSRTAARREDAFMSVIKSAHGLKGIEGFMKSSMGNAEILQFYLAVDTFRNLDREQLIVCAQNVYNRYLADDATTRVQVCSGETTKHVQDMLAVETVDVRMFDSIQEELLAYMRTTVFPKFVLDESYHECKKLMDDAMRPRSQKQAKPPRDGNYVYRRGWLVKRGAVVPSWKRRYFVLTAGVLFSYKQPSDERPLKRFLVDDCSIFKIDEKRNGREHCFEVATTNRVFLLQAENAADRESWRRAFEEQDKQMRELRELHKAGESALRCNIECAETVKASRSFTAYKICVQTPGLTWYMRRRFSEFVELNRALCKEFGDVMFRFRVAEFPSRQVLFNNMDEHIIQQRMSVLNAYLQDIVCIPVIASSMGVLQFLGLLNSPSSSSISSNPSVKTVDADNVSKIVEVGDILLMRSATSLASLQRTLTNSDWDHVAVVIRVPILSDKPHSLAVFEAVGDGVVVQPLEMRLSNSNSSKQTVAIRKLRWERNPQRLLSLQTFCDNVTGKAKYSLKGFFSRKKNQNDVSYYCAELVAACFEALHVLPDGAASSKPWLPVHFSCRKQLELVDASLDSDELFIVFDHIALATASVTDNNRGTERRHSVSLSNGDGGGVNGARRGVPTLSVDESERKRRVSDPGIGASDYHNQNITLGDAKSKKLANILGNEFTQYSNFVRQKSGESDAPSNDTTSDDGDDVGCVSSDGLLSPTSPLSPPPQHLHPTSPSDVASSRRKDKLAAMLGHEVNNQ